MNWLSTTLTPRIIGIDVRPSTPPSMLWKKPDAHTAAISTNMAAKNTSVGQSTFFTTSARLGDSSTIGAAAASAMYVSGNSTSGRSAATATLAVIMTAMMISETRHSKASFGSSMPSSCRCIGRPSNSSRKNSRSTMKASSRLTTVGTNSADRNDENGAEMPPPTAIRRFWGFPMGLMALPIVTENASASRSIFGDTSSVLA